MGIFQANELSDEVQKLKNELATSQQMVRSATTDEERKQHGSVVDMKIGDSFKTEKEWRDVREKDGL